MRSRLVILAVSALIAAGSPTALSRSSDHPLQFEVTVPDSVPLGRPMEVTVAVTNPAPLTQSAVYRVGVAAADRDPQMFAEGVAIAASGETLLQRFTVTPGQWFSEHGEYRVVISDRPELTRVFEVERPDVLAPVFEDVTGEVGLATSLFAEPFCVGGSYAAGAAWADVDKDGDLDLFLPRHKEPARLFINHGGRFVDEAAERGVDNLDRTGLGAVFADFDNDGDQDLYVVNEEVNRLYRNDGTGHFEDVAEAAGVASSTPDSSAAWGDFDGDGHLDLFVTNWGRRCEDESNRLIKWTLYPDKLYRNNGNGTFTDVTHLLHRTGSTMGNGLQGAWVDYDRDGDVDLYLGNDYMRRNPAVEPNVLWRNDGPGPDGWVFTNVSDETKANVAVHSMGIGIADYDRDGRFEFAISNIRDTALLDWNGERFLDIAHAAGVARPMQDLETNSVTWGLAFYDFNNDGWEDLYVAAGQLENPNPQPNAMFTNGRDGTFLDHTAVSGAGLPDTSRGIAFADFDRDGRMDIFVVNQNASPVLYRNVTPTKGRTWLQVRTRGRVSNRDGCGATVIVKLSAKKKLVRQVFCGSTSFSSGSDPTVHFGLGQRKAIKKLIVKWPSGIRQERAVRKLNRRIVLPEKHP